MSTLVTEEHETPGLPETKSIYSPSLKSSHTLWHMLYKQGNNPRKEMIFEFSGDIQRAIQRGRSYCQRMNFIFIHVEAFLHDLEEDERNYTNQG